MNRPDRIITALERIAAAQERLAAESSGRVTISRADMDRLAEHTTTRQRRAETARLVRNGRPDVKEQS